MGRAVLAIMAIFIVVLLIRVALFQRQRRR
jgi:hypothetical protein